MSDGTNSLGDALIPQQQVMPADSLGYSPVVMLEISLLVNPGAVRLALTITLILCLTIACLSEFLVVLSFSLNHAFIAKNLCENREEPGNACQGCCLLRKQLANEERKEQSPPAKNPTESFSFQAIPLDAAVRLFRPREGEAIFIAQPNTVPSPPGRDIDHPPETSLL
jgi:hypothetical protein